MTTDNTQELDDLCPICNGSMWQMNAEYEEVPCWHDIHDKNIKQAILDWHNKQIEEVLDRLESKGLNEDGGSRYVNTSDGYVAATAWNEAQDRVERVIEAERNKLKESR